MSALLSVQDLSVSFTTYGRTVQVLKSVSLDVPEGAQIALVGESGSGKSVTMKTIMGILPIPPARIDSGTILFDGRDLLTMPERDRLRLRGTAMSMVFQDPMSSLNPVFTIKDQLGTILICRPAVGAHAQCPPKACADSRGAVAGANARPRARGRIFPHHAVGWDAPARADRNGAIVRAAPADRR